MPPLPHENGWKDTVIMLPRPGDAHRGALGADGPAGEHCDPAECISPSTRAATHGYVWHCHIVDHEDNEMMRPDEVIANPAATTRDYVKGSDY